MHANVQASLAAHSYRFRLSIKRLCFDRLPRSCRANLRRCMVQPPDAIQAALGIDRAQLLALDATLATGNIYQNATSLCHQEVLRCAVNRAHV